MQRQSQQQIATQFRGLYAMAAVVGCTQEPKKRADKPVAAATKPGRPRLGSPADRSQVSSAGQFST